MNRTAQHAIRMMLLGALVASALGSAAYGQEYPPAEPPHTGNLHATVSTNGVIDVSGENCGASEAVTITFDDNDVASATTDADGAFSTSFDVPDGTEAGSHRVVASNDICELTTTVTVSAADSGGSLPFTGSSSSMGFLMAIMALVVGAGLVVLARNRRGLAKALRS